MERIPEPIIQAAFLRQEYLDGLEIHPDCEKLEASKDKAYEVMDKLNHEKIIAIESAWAGELSAYFAVGYALGLADGMGTGKAIAEGAATR